MQLVHFTTDCPNFGDDLNADLWPALAPELFAGGDDVAFVGIGTILGMPRIAQRRIEVFSTGAGNDPPHGWDDRAVTFHCVRGPVTARLMGLSADHALTDGAILTPQLPDFPSHALGGGGICVIPHFQTIAFGGWEAACQQAGLRLIDPRGTTAEVIAQVASADLVLTESLHGAILADTYGIPWRAFATSRNFGVPKWIDWTASVGLPFELTMLAPPNIAPLLAYGRRAEPFGATLRFGLEDAVQEVRLRLSGPAKSPGLPTAFARKMLLSMPMLQGALGYTPRRTAQGLTDMAHKTQGEGMVSAASLRLELTERMMERLAAMVRAQPRRACA